MRRWWRRRPDPFEYRCFTCKAHYSAPTQEGVIAVARAHQARCFSVAGGVLVVGSELSQVQAQRLADAFRAGLLREGVGGE